MKGHTSSLILLLAIGSGADPVKLEAQETAVGKHPLSALPYTPSLDLASMDRTVDPCVDFFRYACGGWIKNNPIPGDEADWNVYAKLEAENEQFLWGLLTEASRPEPSRSPASQKIGDHFGTCMDEPALEAAGAKALTDDLGAIEGLASREQLASLLGRLHPGLGTNAMLFGFGADQDFKDSTRVIAFAFAGGLGLPDRDYYVKADAKAVETRQKYAAHVQKMLELLGDAPADAAVSARTVVRLETALAKAALTRVDRRNPDRIYHPMTLRELQALTPSFRWNDYITGIGLAAPAVLNVTEPAFYRAVEKTVRGESLGSLKGYLRWQLLNARAEYLSPAFVQAHFDFFGAYLRGVKEMPPRWKRCVEYVDRDLGEALGQVFVEKTFGPKVKASTLEMVGRIEAAMERRIRELPWMGQATKTRALEKLRTMDNKIGYPDRWRDYGPLEVTRGDFLGNVTRANRFDWKRRLTKIGRPVDRGEWQMTPPTVNAYYNPSMNDMNFPAGVLLPPLFDPRMDEAPNYGNTGSTIGHELTHGFDDQGRRFDAHGNLRDWWTKADGKEFEKRAGCIADQYARYTVVDDVKINNLLTLGEDVADLGGTIIAYLAWKEATRGEDLKPADGLTPDQRFFVGFAQWACGSATPSTLRVDAVTDPHSPPEHRINGVVANIPEFREAFGCKAGQPMVREPVCRVW